MPLTEAVANPHPLQAQCGPPLLPRVGEGSRPQALGVFAEAEALFIVHRGSPSCQILPAPSVSLRCSVGEYRQCWEGGGVGWERLHRCHRVPRREVSGGSQHPWGREEGGQGLGVLVGAVSKLWGHRGSFCSGRARSTIPTACSRLLLCLSIPREQGGLGGAAEGGTSVLLSRAPSPWGSHGFQPALPAGSAATSSPGTRGFAAPFPTRPQPGGVQHLPRALVLPVLCRRGRMGSGAAATLVRGRAQLPTAVTPMLCSTGSGGGKQKCHAVVRGGGFCF